MKPAIWGFALLLAVAAMPGCHSGERLVRTAPMALPDVSKLGYAIRWVQDMRVPEGVTVTSKTVLGDLVVAIEYPGNQITGLSLDNGTVRWHTWPVHGPDRLFEPVRRKNRVIVNTESSIYHLDTDTGRVTNITPLPSLVNSAPAIVGDVEVYGSGDHKVYGVELDSGMMRWAYTMSNSIYAKPILVGGGVFVADTNGVFALLVADKGDVDVREQGSFDGVVATPVSGQNTGLIYVPSRDHNLYAITRNTLHERWVFRTTEEMVLSPILLGNTLYVRLPKEGKLVALDAISGNELWRVPSRINPVAIMGDKVLAYSAKGLLTFDPNTGSTTQEVPVADTVTSVITGPDGSLLMFTATGMVLRLDRK